MSELMVYQKWLQQAENDYEWAADSLKSKHYSQVCFVAQQVAVKAVKAYAFYMGNSVVKSYSIFNILKELNINGEVSKKGKRLDTYYTSARYPDAVPDNSLPYEFFDVDDAKEAIGFAREILDEMKKLCQIQKS